MPYRQERWTHQDTLEHQLEMIQLMNEKINGEKPFFENDNERYEFFSLVSFSLMGQGPLSKIIPQANINGIIIPLGKDVHHFALQMMYVDADDITIMFREKAYTLKTRDLWRILLHYFLILFPRAQTEALHMSHEVQKNAKKSSGFVFDPSKRL